MSEMLLLNLAGMTIRTIGIALLAGIAALCIRSVAARHAIWTAVLVSVLLMPVMDGIAPRTIVHAPGSIITPPIGLIAAFQMDDAPEAKESLPVAAAPRPAINLWPIAAAIYLLVTSILLVRFGFACWQVRQLRRISNALPLSILRNVQAARGISSTLILREAESVRVPLTIGWIRPAIILPADWRMWDDWTLRAALSHELTHIRRRDYLIALLAAFGTCVFWFNPLSWWLKQHLSVLSEEAADDASVSLTGDAERYAETLLRFASAAQRGQRLKQGGLAMARLHVKSRIERILTGRYAGTGTLPGAGWIVIFLIAGPVLYAAAAIRVAPAGAQPAMLEAPAAESPLTIKPLGTSSFKKSGKPSSLLPQEPEGSQAQHAPDILQYVAPAYSPLAIQARVQGVVILSVLIGSDGKVTDLRVVSGHPLLTPAAIEAVKQWVFVSGTMQPVNVMVPFRLTTGEIQGGAPNSISASSEAGLRSQVADKLRRQYDAASRMPAILSRVEPVFPPLARQARVSGTVVLSVNIGQDGKPTDIAVISGHPLLSQAAIDAVKQWVFASGSDHPVTIPISFSLGISPTITATSVTLTPNGFRLMAGNAADPITVEIAGFQGKPSISSSNGVFSIFDGTSTRVLPGGAATGAVFHLMPAFQIRTNAANPQSISPIPGNSFELTCQVRECIVTTVLDNGSTSIRSVGINETGLITIAGQILIAVKRD